MSYKYKFTMVVLAILIALAGFAQPTQAAVSVGPAIIGPVVIHSNQFEVTATSTLNSERDESSFNSDLTFNLEPTGLVLGGGVLLFTARALRQRR